MVVIPPHNLDPNSGKWGTVITKLLHDLLDGTTKANQTAERAIKSNSDVLAAVQQTNTQVAETNNVLQNGSRIPAAPENIATATANAWDALGNPAPTITVTWDTVSEDADAEGLEIAGYEVWWKTGAAVYLPDAEGNPTDAIDSSYYKRITTVHTNALVTAVESNTAYSFVVRAVSVTGINGIFSVASDITSVTAGATIPAPSKPTVSQTLGVVSVVWNGAFVSGGTPSYFRYVKVLQATSSGGTYSDTGQTLSGSGGIAISGLTDGQGYYYKLQAVDSAGHASGLSVASDSITPEGVDLSALETEINTANQNAADALSAANTAQTAADDAQADATAASTAAANAAGIANSKAVVLYQTTAPAASYQNSLTLWIDTTSNANTPKRWNGSTWVAVTDKVATDAASTAAAANSAAGAAQTAANTAQATANTAITNAAAADSKAVTAQTTANGKNTIYYQTAAPSGGTYKANDIWYDTDDGYKMYVRVGSTWTASQLGSNAIATGAVTATQIASAVNTAITTAQTTATNAASAASAADGKAVTAQNTANVAKTDAATAQTAADNAASAASTAAGIANSKGKVLIQSTAPAVADQLAQNLWIDTTSNANTPKKWSGSNWVAVTDKAATDAASAAVAAQTTATNAATAASAAQSKADSAFANAATAQTTANNAADAAATANTNAGNAQTTANTAVSNAATAQTAADDAADAAATAAGIANGKGKVIFATSAPTGADAAATTLWIDTTGGANTPKRWVSGTTWSVVTDKAATDAASAAASANTAAGNAQTTANTAVTNAVIAKSAADAAQAKADSAFVNAGNAQTTANGKNVVTYSTSAASSATPGTRAGDVWFQQTSGVVAGQWVWSGSAWVQQTLSNTVIASLDAGKITSGSISAARIAANTITSAMIAANTIVAADIASGTITATQMLAGTITAASGIIADAAITTAKIANLAVTDAQIANGTITNASIADATIQSAKIAALDAGKITSGYISAARINAGTITSTMIASNTIVAGDIAAGTITATEIAANTITAAKIAAGTITATEIASGAITTAKLNATAINGMTITGATVQTTATASRGVKVDSTGLSAYNSVGTRTVFIDAATGALTATSGSFTGTVNATSGAIAGKLTMGTQGTSPIGTVPSSSDSWGFIVPGGMYTYANFSNSGVVTQYTMASFTSGALRSVNIDEPSGDVSNGIYYYNGYRYAFQAGGSGPLIEMGSYTNDADHGSLYHGTSLELNGGPGGSGSGALTLDNTGVTINSPLNVPSWNISAHGLSLTTPLTAANGGTGVTSLPSLKTALGFDDTGWVAVTFKTGYTSYDEGNNKCYYRVKNGEVLFTGLVKPTAGGYLTTAGADIVAIPSGLEPPVQGLFITATPEITAVGKITAKPTGVLRLESTTTANGYSIYVSLGGVRYFI